MYNDIRIAKDWGHVLPGRQVDALTRQGFRDGGDNRILLDPTTHRVFDTAGSLLLVPDVTAAPTNEKPCLLIFSVANPRMGDPANIEFLRYHRRRFRSRNLSEKWTVSEHAVFARFAFDAVTNAADIYCTGTARCVAGRPQSTPNSKRL